MAEGNTCARILIADGQALFRAAMRKLLELDPGIKHIKEASNGREVIEQLDEFQPDIVLLDMNMPQQSGLEVLRRLNGVPVKTLNLWKNQTFPLFARKNPPFLVISWPSLNTTKPWVMTPALVIPGILNMTAKP